MIYRNPGIHHSRSVLDRYSPYKRIHLPFDWSYFSSSLASTHSHIRLIAPSYIVSVTFFEWPYYIYIYIYIFVKNLSLEVQWEKEIFWSTKRFVFFKIYLFISFYLFHSYIRLCFQLIAFVREPIWHKALCMGYSMRLEFTRVWSLNGFQLVMGLYSGHSFLLSLSLSLSIYIYIYIYIYIFIEMKYIKTYFLEKCSNVVQ